MADLEIDETGDGVAFGLKVSPGSGKSCVTGLKGGALAVCVKSPPEGGKANKEVVKTIAKALRVGADAVRISGGKKSRRKRVRISGITRAELDERLGPLTGG